MLEETQTKADKQLVENRMYIEKRERDHQQELDQQVKKYERIIGEWVAPYPLVPIVTFLFLDEIKEKMKLEKAEVEANFEQSMKEIKVEFARELTYSADAMSQKHKKELGKCVRSLKL